MVYVSYCKYEFVSIAVQKPKCKIKLRYQYATLMGDTS